MPIIDGSHEPNTIFTPKVLLADFNADGKADLLLHNAANGTGYLGVGDGKGNFAFQPLSWGPGYDFVVAEDVNGDGVADIILYNDATGTSYTGIETPAPCAINMPCPAVFRYTYSL